MNREDIINSELDKIIEIFDSNAFKIQQFEVYSPFFKSLCHKNRKKFNQPRACIYPNCNSLSIKKSHSIAKSNSLKVIADDGHLLQPTFDYFGKNCKLSMQSVGINNASTFPGFCETHEKIFQSYENRKDINEDFFVQLQSYRAICREIVSLNIEIELIEEELYEYRKIINQEALTTLKESLKIRGIELVLQEINIKGTDSIITQLQGMKNEFEKRLVYLRKGAGLIHHELNNNTVENERKTINFGVSIDHKFPVSLCGYTALAYDNEYNENKKMLLTVNVIPLRNCTYIFCYANKKHSKLFKNITNYYFQSPLTILNFIESFMTHSSDHWFINPSYWESFSKVKQEMILAEILNVDKLIIHEFEYSIFDDIRKTILLEYEKNKALFTEADHLIVGRERKKLTNLSTYTPPSEEQLIENIENYWRDRFL